MSTIQTTIAPRGEIDRLSQQFGKQASFVDCENHQSVGSKPSVPDGVTSKTSATGYPISLGSHKPGEMTQNAFSDQDRQFGKELSKHPNVDAAVTMDGIAKNALNSVTSEGSFKPCLATNQAHDPKQSGCTSNIPDSTRNLKPMIKEAIFSQTAVIGPVANKPSGMQPQPSLTSRSSRTDEGNTGEASSKTSDALTRGHAALRSKQGKNDFPTTNEISVEKSASQEEAINPSNEKKTISDIFKERLVQDAKARRKEMVFADQMEMRDPQMAADFAASIFENMRKQELQLGIKADYLQTVQVKSEVKDTSRAFLVEWIIDVHRKFRLMPESLYLTVLIVDRYLSLVQIKKSQLHILGLTAILIATKYEEIYPPSLQELLSVSENKFSRRDVIEMEHMMLSKLEFGVLAPSSYRFLERFSKLCTVAHDEQTFFFAQYIQEISLLDESLLKYRPSEIAAGSLILATKAIKKQNAWNNEMERSTSMKEETLHRVTEDVKSFVTEVNPKFLTTLKYKFQKPDYKEVANLPFNF